MSKDCTLCSKPIDGGHYICKYPSSFPCAGIWHTHCFENGNTGVQFWARCKCHALHKDNIVRAEVVEGTSEDKKITNSQVAEGTSEDKKNSDSQLHPDEFVWYLGSDGYHRMKESERKKLMELENSQGIPRRRGM